MHKAFNSLKSNSPSQKRKKRLTTNAFSEHNRGEKNIISNVWEIIYVYVDTYTHSNQSISSYRILYHFSFGGCCNSLMGFSYQW